MLPGPMAVSNTLSRRTNALGYKTVRAQIAACLLCLLIVGASLDGLPDPPAVKPQGNRNNLVSQLHFHVPFAAKKHASDCPASAPHIQASLFSFGQIFEARGPSESLQVFIRLIRYWLAGTYAVPVQSILMAVGAVIYFISSFDLIPDAVPFLGLVDDVCVINSVARANLRVISSFRNWEVSFR